MFGFRPSRLLDLQSDRKNARKQGSGRRSTSGRSQIRQLLGEPLEHRRVLAAYLVNTADDIVAEDGMVSLREAVQAANTNAVVNADTVAGDTGPGITDTITFADGLSAITLGSELTISDSLSISLGTATAQSISGDGASRIFSIDAGNDASVVTTVSVEGLTLSDGVAERGGAIFVSSGQSLLLDSVTLANNTATGSGSGAGGGALFNDGGSVTIVDSTISGNSAAVSSSVSLTGAQENPPVTTSATGDATFIYDPAGNTFSIDLFVTGVEVENDEDEVPQVTGAHLHVGDAGVNGGVIVNLNASNFVTEAGGIRLRLTDADFPTENIDDLAAGGIYINVHSTDNPSGEVRGQLVFPMTMGSGGGLFNAGGALTITDSTIDGNIASRAGGGIESAGGTLTMSGVTLSNNIAGPVGFATPGNGGGLHISGDGNAVINGGTVSGNIAAREGGGLWNSVGTMTVDGTTIVNNVASGDAADDGGGGIFNNGGTLTVSDAIITANAADGTLGSGGGIFSTDGNVTIDSTRIGGPVAADGNLANRAGGGVEVVDGNLTLNLGTDVSFNTAGINGGGLHSTGAAIVTSNMVIFGSNTAASEGGGLWNSATGTLSINGGSITSNVASGNNAANGGGGLFNNGGDLQISGATIDGNVADGSSGSGGGILNLGGSLTVINTAITDNTANRAGGGIEVTDGSATTLTNVSLDGNNAGVSPAIAAPGNGGGLHVSGGGTVSVIGGTVNNNIAASEGGGLWNGSGTMTVSGTMLSGNTASGIDNDNGGAALFNNGGTLRVSDANIADNIADGVRGGGGGVMNVAMGVLDITGTSITGNSAAGTMMGDGGGAVLNIDGSVTISDSTLSGNAATGTAGSGGAILTRAGSLTVTDTIISGNTANRAGGGIEVGRATVMLNNITLGGDEAADGNSVAEDASPGNGGGLHVTFDSDITIIGGSVSNNRAIEGGGLWNSATGLMTIDGTMIASNTAVRGGGIYNQEADPMADQTFALTFVPLNDSGVSGVGNVTVSSPTETTRTVRVVIDAEGLQDLTGIPGAVHVAHIHGQFAGNATRPVLEQGDGPFFDGAGGLANGSSPVSSVLPTLAADDGRTIEDGFLDFLEGRPQYGPVVLNLTSTQLRDADGGSNPPDGTPPLMHFLNLLTAGEIDAAALFPNGTEFNLDTTYTFDLTNADEARQFSNLSPLGLREVVLHGKTIATDISDVIDVAAMGTAPAGIDLGDGMSFRVTAPVAAATIDTIGGSVRISNANIVDNLATGDEASDGGGGIHNSGNVTLSNSTVTDNVANGISGSGGGVWNASLFKAEDTFISGNMANRAGGGIEATAGSSTTLTDVNLDGNNVGVSPAVAAPGNGGGLHITGNGNATITGGTVNNNVAASEGGGLWNGSGVMTVTGVTIDGNTASGNDADNGGGGLFNVGGTVLIDSSMITNNIADGSSGSGGGVLNAGTMTITNSTITSNNANRAGGGIEAIAGSTTTIRGGTLSNNIAGPTSSAAPGNGGGLHITGDGVAALSEATVDRNSAANEGGGLWNSAAGMLSVNRSTISNNASGDGGGIFNDGAAGDVTVINSTIAGNTATASGGAIASEGAAVELTSVTIADNTAATGGGISTIGGTVAVTNSIVSRNTATTDNDVFGALVDTGSNLIGVSAGLSTLADNGGPTQTIALLAGSPALGAGVAAGLATDQRGIARPQGSGVDIGAFESDLSAPTATLSITSTDADKNEGDAGTTTFTFTVSRSDDVDASTSVDFAVVGSGADPADAADFGGSLPSGTIIFAAGETSKTITIDVMGDNLIEQDETFTVTLSNATNPTTIATATAIATIQDDDFAVRETRIFVPTLVTRPHVIPGDSIPTAIIFQAISDTVVTVTPIGSASVGENIRILDGNTNPIGTFTGGITTATVTAGGLYAVIFEPQTTNRIYSIESSAGFSTLSSSPPTNIFEPTDTNANGETTSLDALLVINNLRSVSPTGAEGEQIISSSMTFLDVNRDGRVSAIDALRVINHLSRQRRPISNTADERGQDFLALSLPSSSTRDHEETNDAAVATLFDGEQTMLHSQFFAADPVDAVANSGPSIESSAADAAFDELQFDSDGLNLQIELLTPAV
ncbi:CHRD domain-containing protein [Rubripirellula reticaptiva]|uniref:Putative outer membrane protein pmp20 n=1 Tax=Rubripirellula reticaptiva TaxID=2528013 RepID=A0A5C6FC83_9BACT|nr:CHRD domain-containing protein [Rubripirellula reticaptiva]TWU58392.1 putative outer membrane protein pmp20 precursor [Rubripirellula reticaptiva]